MSLILYILIGIIVILIIWIVRMEMRLRKLCRGKNAASLENIMIDIGRELDSLNSSNTQAHQRLDHLDSRMKKSIRGIETIRFNPFKDQGSNQSFAIAMLNEDGDGLVLSSLYSRERMSVFAKPIKGMKSDHELTEEEEAVLVKATPKK